MQLNNKMNVTK